MYLFDDQFWGIKVMQFKRTTVISYSLLLVIVSSLMTVLFYHVFVFKSFSSESDNQTSPQKELTIAQAEKSPIKENNSIIEVMSYGCHYCAANEDNVREFVKKLPAGVVFESIHINTEKSGLSAFAPIFATLQEMGVEPAVRDSAYNAIIARGINLTDTTELDKWLVKNSIDAAEYKKARTSEAVKHRLDEMSAITDFYDITATPIFIINKRFVVAQDSSFSEFSKRMLNLLGKDK